MPAVTLLKLVVAPSKPLVALLMLADTPLIGFVTPLIGYVTPLITCVTTLIRYVTT
jgi:hypothetical protein